MAKIVRDRAIVDNEWSIFYLPASLDLAKLNLAQLALPPSPVLLPLSVWLAHHEALIARAHADRQALGIWLAPDDDPQKILPYLDVLSVIAVDFPRPAEGRGYSIATLLRTRYGWRGELRAINSGQNFGYCGRDYVGNLERAGFNAFDIGEATSVLQGFDAFTEHYQAAANQPLPLFRRQEA